MPPDPAELEEALAELELLEADLALCHHRRRRRLRARLAADVEALEATVELRTALALDDAPALPAGARRALTPAERASRVSFAGLEDEVDAITDRLTAAMVTARGEVADELAGLLDDAAAGRLPGGLEALAHVPDLGDLPDAPGPLRRLAATMDALDDPAIAVPLGAATTARMTATAAGELELAAGQGYTRVLAEAQAQGAPVHRDPLRTAPIGAQLDRSAAAIGAAPAKHARDLAVDAYRRLPVYAMAPGDAIAAIRQAERDASPARLADTARPAVHSANGLGRLEAAGTPATPTIAYIYASELLDRNTCGPCSRVDGRRYADLDEARLDYPEGRYVRCEGGVRCRGTLVYVWSDEAEAGPEDRGPDVGDPIGPPPPPPPPVAPAPAPPPRATPAPAATPQPASPAEARRAADDALLRRPLEELTRAERDERAKALRRRQRRTEQENRRNARDPVYRQAVADRYGVTLAQLEDARAALPDLKAALKLEARQHGHDWYARTTNSAGSFPRLPRKRQGSRGYDDAAWDWLEQVSAEERRRIQRWATGDPDLVDLEEWANVWAREHAGADLGGQLGSSMRLEDILEEWREAIRHVDGAKAVEAGRVPSYIDVDQLAPELSDALGLDAGLLLGEELEAAGNLAVALNERAALEASRLLGRGGSKLGPDPWRMTPESYREELLDLEDRLIDARQAGIRPHPADVDRWRELIPGGDDLDLDGNPLSPEALYELVMGLARAAGRA